MADPLRAFLVKRVGCQLRMPPTGIASSLAGSSLSVVAGGVREGVAQDRESSGSSVCSLFVSSLLLDKQRSSAASSK